MSQSNNENSIACTLNSQDYNERRRYVRESLLPFVSDVEDLNKSANPAADLPVGIRLIFTKSAQLRDQIESFVELERQCCGFLTFTISEPDECLTLTIQGPLIAQPALDIWKASVHTSRMELSHEASN